VESRRAEYGEGVTERPLAPHRFSTGLDCQRRIDMIYLSAINYLYSKKLHCMMT
jgi:hypothetical protein